MAAGLRGVSVLAPPPSSTEGQRKRLKAEPLRPKFNVALEMISFVSFRKSHQFSRPPHLNRRNGAHTDQLFSRIEACRQQQPLYLPPTTAANFLTACGFLTRIPSSTVRPASCSPPFMHPVPWASPGLSSPTLTLLLCLGGSYFPFRIPFWACPSLK